VTDGSAWGLPNYQDEFRYKNEKSEAGLRADQAGNLEAKISPDEAEIRAAYEKNKANTRRRTARGALRRLWNVKSDAQSVQVSDDMLKQQYQTNDQQYQVPTVCTSSTSSL